MSLTENEAVSKSVAFKLCSYAALGFSFKLIGVVW